MPKKMRDDQRSIVEALDRLPDEERLELFSLYCSDCGCKQPWHPGEAVSFGQSTFIRGDPLGCQCENDE